ncbi:helix-turn-helix domain-containing protein [Halobacillus kuroshimensis]|uniref:helix-turn-helix domain-containing protein n=1 Tax=Halobacillus kuroshimensis TaxID=302481 RepID=UPI00040C0B7C|nr:helix-turn-helix transcriptional regulator [Halobacillus kuroshimensis]
MLIGTLLKYHRKRLGLTQETLAEALVSKSFLSRIENNKVEAHEDTLTLLFKRLEVDYTFTKNWEEGIKEELGEWEEYLTENDRLSSERMYKQLNHKLNKILSIDLLLEYHEKCIRHCKLQGLSSVMRDSLKVLEEFFHSLDKKKKFFYFKYLGVHELYNDNYEEAEKALSSALREFEAAFLPELELADVYYLYGKALYLNRKEAKSLYFTKLALKFFQDNYKLNMCAYAHLILGLIHNRLGNKDGSHSNIVKAKELAESQDLTTLLGEIHHNLGIINIIDKDICGATYNLKKSIELNEKVNTNKYIDSLLLLTYVRYTYESPGEGLRIVESTLYNSGDKSMNPIQRVEVKFWGLFAVNKKEEWEVYVEKKLLPLLLEDRIDEKILIYSFLLASYYERNSYYKKSTYYYKLILKVYSNYKL